MVVSGKDKRSIKMKKILSALTAVLVLCGACSAGVRVIPYPEGLDTTSEGASSAPAEINHKGSVYFDTVTDFYEAASTESTIINRAVSRL